MGPSTGPSIERHGDLIPRTASMKLLVTAATMMLGVLTALPPAPLLGQEAPRPYAEARDYAKWEKEVAAYESADRQSPPPKGGILFIGSSTIRRRETIAAGNGGPPVRRPQPGVSSWREGRGCRLENPRGPARPRIPPAMYLASAGRTPSWGRSTLLDDGQAGPQVWALRATRTRSAVRHRAGAGVANSSGKIRWRKGSPGNGRIG